MSKTKKRSIKESDKPLDSYLATPGEVIPKTIRASDRLWARVDGLAAMKQSSMNAVVVAALEKVCDDEGIS